MQACYEQVGFDKEPCKTDIDAEAFKSYPQCSWPGHPTRVLWLWQPGNVFTLSGHFAHSLPCPLLYGFDPTNDRTRCDSSIFRSVVRIIQKISLFVYVNIFLLIFITPSEIESEAAIQVKTSNH